MAHSPDLSSFFSPDHIALLGVSRNPSRDSNAYLRVLVDGGYAGRISVMGAADYGQAESISSVDELPENVDVVFNMLRPSLAEDTLITAAKRGAKFGILFAGGFAESGDEGAETQRRIVETCNSHGMRIVGPNCMGMFNTWHSTNLSEIDNVPRGHIGVVSQSGNNGITMVREAHRFGTGLSSFVSFGNQADLPAHDYIRAMGADPHTKVIVLYLEGIQPGQAAEFIAACREVSVHTPIVGLKGGRGTAGSRAAASHTASLSQAPQAYSALFRQAGVIEVEHLHHLLPTAEALLRCPPLKGDRITVVGSGGGHSTVAADAIEAVGLKVPEYSESLQADIATHLPFGAPVKNPVDMTGTYLQDATLFAQLTAKTFDQGDFDGAVCFGLYGPEHWVATQPDPDLVPTEAGPALGALQQSEGKPIMFFTIYGDEPHDHLDQLRSAGIPVFPDMGTVAVAMSALRQRGRQLGLASETDEPRSAPDAHGSVLDEADSLALLATHGVPLPQQVTVSSPEAVGEAVAAMAGPAVIKGVLPGVAHKSELGAVKLGITTAAQGVEAAHDIASSVQAALGDGHLKGFLVVEDLGRNRELIVGVQRDSTFGAVAVIGQGGLHAEQIKDVALGVLPLSDTDLEALIDSLRSAQVWTGSRGQSGVDIAALGQLLKSVSAAMEADSSIESVDLNPVIVRADGSLAAADAAVHLGADA